MNQQTVKRMAQHPLRRFHTFPTHCAIAAAATAAAEAEKAAESEKRDGSETSGDGEGETALNTDCKAKYECFLNKGNIRLLAVGGTLSEESNRQ